MSDALPPGHKVLATDLDDTVLGNTLAVRAFARWRAAADDWLWVVATGRNPDVTLRMLKQAGAPLASKGLALRQVVNHLPGKVAGVIAASDSGNDLALIASADAGIVVANHTGELNMLRSAAHVYWSPKSFAAGVLDGIAHFTQQTDTAFSFARATVDAG